MLRAFVDDSGSGGDSPWFVLAGYLGTVADWDAFDSEWQEVLCAEPRIEYFKMKQAERLRDQFEGFTPEQRDAKINALIDVILKRARQAVYVRAKQKDYDEIVKTQVPEMWDNAYFFLFPAFVTCCTSLEKWFGNSEPIHFVFDSHERFENPSKQLYNQILGAPVLAGRIVNVDYEDDKQFLPLQAADLLAWQVRRAFSFPQEKRRAHYDRANSCAWPPYSYILSRQDLQQGVDLMEQRARDYAQSLGVPLSAVQPWKNKGKGGQ